MRSDLITWSELRRDITNFVAFKRRLGFVYEGGERSLRRFQRFVEPSLREGPLSLKTIVEKYTAECGKLSCGGFALDVARVRLLCLYRRRRHPQAYVPDSHPVPRRKFLPYLLSNEEVRKTLIAARRYGGPNAQCSGEALYLVALICYCTGLRIGEAIRLQLDDVDLKACTFRIRKSKRRTRVVPFGQDLAQEIRKYLQLRSTWVPSSSGAKTLLVDFMGRSLRCNRIRRLLVLLWRELGLKPPRGDGGPRPTDLRHAFARGRLEVWDRQGKDVNALLPWLSAYMGHKRIVDTEVYLHSTPGLLRRASRRFERLYRQAGSP